MSCKDCNEDIKRLLTFNHPENIKGGIIYTTDGQRTVFGKYPYKLKLKERYIVIDELNPKNKVNTVIFYKNINSVKICYKK